MDINPGETGGLRAHGYDLSTASLSSRWPDHVSAGIHAQALVLADWLRSR